MGVAASSDADAAVLIFTNVAPPFILGSRRSHKNEGSYSRYRPTPQLEMGAHLRYSHPPYCLNPPLPSWIETGGESSQAIELCGAKNLSRAGVEAGGENKEANLR